MKSEVIKVGLIAGGVVLILIISVSRVLPYLKNQRNPNDTIGQRQMAQVVTDLKTPQYNPDQLSAGIDELRERLIRKAQAALLALPPGDRPRADAASEIAAVFADFVVLNRAGDLEQATQSYASRGLPLPDELARIPDKAEELWQFATAWARHAQIDPESIRAGVYFLNGQRRRPGFSGAPISSRQLRSGTWIVQDGHDRTAYDMIIRVTVPNLDGKSEHPVDIYIVIVNDRPGGGWDVVQTTWNGLPPGKLFIPPFP